MAGSQAGSFVVNDTPHRKSERTNSFRIVAALILPAFWIAHVVLKHVVGLPALLTAYAIILSVPLLAVIAFAALRWISGKSRVGAPDDPRPHSKKDLYWYAAQSERWRQSLTALILIVILSLCLLLVAAGFLLMTLNKGFDSLILWLTPGMGFLIALTLAIALTFAGAALLGRRLIRITTGRMPFARRAKNGA